MNQKIEKVYNSLIKDTEIQKQINRIKEHEWMQIVEKTTKR